MRNLVLYGDCLTRLKEIPEGSVQTCVTSPPYYGLRDYGTEGQIGQETTPEVFIAKLVEVFAGVRRTLCDDGTLWINIGDSYANDGKWGGSTSGKHAGTLHGNTAVGRGKRHTGLKPKDLIGIPWMLAFALRDDGWFLRSEIIWHKPNVMPESVEDRPTKAHEQLFLLTKNQNYFYDATAIREPASPNKPWSVKTSNGGVKNAAVRNDGGNLKTLGKPADESRNKRSVWSINTQPYKGAHFAVMPPELAATCIKAGSKPGDLVLDPFTGSGTTLMVAKDLDRDYVGVELNSDYAPLIDERLRRAVDEAGQREVFRMMMDDDG